MSCKCLKPFIHMPCWIFLIFVMGLANGFDYQLHILPLGFAIIIYLLMDFLNKKIFLKNRSFEKILYVAMDILFIIFLYYGLF